MSKNAVLSLTVPGYDSATSVVDKWVGVFEAHGKTVAKVDTMLAWWCLNQDWWEVEDAIETDWAWVRPLCLTEEEWKAFYLDLYEGKLLCCVHYKEIDDNGGVSYVEHH